MYQQSNSWVKRPLQSGLRELNSKDFQPYVDMQYDLMDYVGALLSRVQLPGLLVLLCNNNPPT
jgi:hypothetical protein